MNVGIANEILLYIKAIMTSKIIPTKLFMYKGCSAALTGPPGQQQYQAQFDRSVLYTQA